MDKKKLPEADICDRFVRPAMERAGWDGASQIHREFPLRAGRVTVRECSARRADYISFFKLKAKDSGKTTKTGAEAC